MKNLNLFKNILGDSFFHKFLQVNKFYLLVLINLNIVFFYLDY